MIIASVSYPKSSSSRFDHDYYVKTHMPLVKSLWGDMGYRGARLMRGVASTDGAPPAFELITALLFTSVEDLQAALTKFGGEIMGDVPNFTDIQPVIRVNEFVDL